MKKFLCATPLCDSFSVQELRCTLHLNFKVEILPELPEFARELGGPSTQLPVGRDLSDFALPEEIAFIYEHKLGSALRRLFRVHQKTSRYIARVLTVQHFCATRLAISGCLCVCVCVCVCHFICLLTCKLSALSLCRSAHCRSEQNLHRSVRCLLAQKQLSSDRYLLAMCLVALRSLPLSLSLCARSRRSYRNITSQCSGVSAKLLLN